MVTYDRRGQVFKSFDGAYSVYEANGKRVMDGDKPIGVDAGACMMRNQGA